MISDISSISERINNGLDKLMNNEFCRFDQSIGLT